MRRSLHMAVSVAIAVCLVFPPVAGAGLVRSFGHKGVVALAPPMPPGIEVLYQPQSEPAPDGSTYLLVSAAPCQGACSEYLFRFRPDGRIDHGFGGSGYVRLPAEGGRSYSLGVDGRSRPVVARVLFQAKVDGTQAFRYTEGGRLDPAFDGDGRVFLPKMTNFEVGIQAGRGGDILFSEEKENARDVATVSLEELRGNGAPRRTFGGDGFVVVHAPGGFHLAPIPTPDGAVLLVTGECFCVEPSVTRVTARGHLDRDFDRAALQSLPSLSKLGGESFLSSPSVTDAVARPDGGVELFGELGTHGFEARLTPDGHFAQGFGTHGIHRFEVPFGAALPLRDGSVLTVSEGGHGPLRPYLLRPSGTVDRRLRAVALAPYTSLIEATPIGARTIDVTFGRRNDEKGIEPPFVARLRLPSGFALR